MARRLGIAERVEWRGPQAQAAVLDAYRAADIFALPCRVGADGDRDGLPNVLLEAQSQKLPCVSTRISGIPELIQDDVTGLLVEPRAIDALADGAGETDRRSRAAAPPGRGGLRADRRRLLAGRRCRPPRGPVRGVRGDGHEGRLLRAAEAPGSSRALRRPGHGAGAAARAAHGGPRRLSSRRASGASTAAATRRGRRACEALGAPIGAAPHPPPPASGRHVPTSGSPTTCITRRPTGSGPR